MRRLFSTFAAGWPGVGLLILRLAAGIAAIAQGGTRLGTEPPAGAAVLSVVAMAAGILLLAGLWTPVSGSLVGALGLWNAISQVGDPWADSLLTVIGVALTLLGPGAWSIDARLFGWKRIDIHDRKR